MLHLKAKPAFDEFIKTCTPLLKIQSLEDEFDKRVTQIASALGNFKPSSDPVDSLVNFLKADPDFLGIVLALTNLSQEKFLRILSAERFAKGDYGSEWKVDTVISKIRKDSNFARQVANLFLQGRENDLVKQVADFYLAQLELPKNWQSILIDDSTLARSAIRKKLMGEYTDAKGKSVERIVETLLTGVQTKYGIGFGHGQVRLVQKEVDFAIPSLEDPHVMIMISYMETTSSNQTTRANEQQSMYGKIVEDGVRYKTSRVLVNIVDGAGWLARRSDLEKIHKGCHYVLSMNTLDQLEAIICHYTPPKYFVSSVKPNVSKE